MADDDAFGEFSISSFTSDPRATLDSQSRALDSLPEEEEWGDFVKSPQQSQKFDSFVGIGASPVGWVKPIGALPLSIFGNADEEEENDLVNEDRERSNANAGDLSHNYADNGFSKSKSFNIAELYSQASPTMAGNGPTSDSSVRFDWMEKDSIPAGNGFHSITDLNVTSSDSSLHKKSDLDGAIDESNRNQLIKNDNDDLFSGWTVNFKEFNSNLNTANLDLNAPTPNDDSDDGWEFQDACSESKNIDSNNKVDYATSIFPAKSANSSGNLSGSSKALKLFGTGTATDSIDLFAKPMESVDLFATSTDISHSSQEVNWENIQPSKASSHAFVSETNSKSEQSAVQDTQNHSIEVTSAEFDEDFGDFTAASSETMQKTGKKDMNLNHQRSAIPLSLFEDVEPESDLPLDAQDAFVCRSFSASDKHSYPSSISIKDLVSSLYRESEKTCSSNTAQQLDTVQSKPSNSGSNSSSVKDTDDLDDTSWVFKDSFSQSRVENDASLSSFGDTCTITTSKLNLDNYLDFYAKLKEELCFLSKHQIENLKQSQGDAAFSGEEESIASLNCEFQMVFKELEQMDHLFEEHEKQDHRSSANDYFSEFVENLQKPHFQILESEYHLTQKLMFAKKDLKSTMELIRHASVMLKILGLGTSEEQTTYMSTWSDIISICIQELKDGALIWTETEEKRVKNELLAETQGRNFVLALGEIYRVVVLLGASAKLFKPWTISGCVDSSSIFTLLDECHVLWSTSGLEEALSSISVSTALDDTPLINSIKDIRGLDAHTLQNYVFSEKDHTCRVSMLSPRMAAGMKMIKWEEDHYFVTLANLWGNLICSDPPKLPRLQIVW